uniref:Uncharacterized protein n=1 Tax=Amanita inopinata TaxID=933333 RepID=A0A5Q0N2R7_9AGAR|nr:hypothetical protein [Amanita inopinata]QFZ98600.1 hypothetical protein [Amanita inopinata]
MLRNTLKDCLKVLVGGGTLLTYVSFYNSIKDKALQERADLLQSSKDELAAKLKNKQLDETHSELVKVKIEALKNQLLEVNKSGEYEIKIISKIDANDPNALSNIKHHVDNLTRDTKKGNEILDKIIDTLNSKNQFWDGSIDSIKDIIKSWSEMLSTLNITELGALTHLLSAVFILFCLFTIIGIVYSEFLLSYFKLEVKYPRLGRFLKIRKMFQQYYLFINFMFIIITLLAIIFINIQILF